jgi:hypothetical protein
MDNKEIAIAALHNDTVKWNGSKYTCIGYKRIYERNRIINTAILKDEQGRLYDVLTREVEKV